MDHGGQGRDELLDDHTGGVDHQIVVLSVKPLLTGKEFVIVGALAVHFLDVAGKLFVGQRLLVGGRLGAAALHTGGHIGVDEELEGVVLAENIIGTASDDHSVTLGGKLLDDVVLLGVDLSVEIHGSRGVGKEGPADGDGIVDDGLLFNDAADVILSQAASSCDLGDDLIVVVGVAQLLCQALTKLSAAAAELTVDGNDFAHRCSSFVETMPLRCFL